MATAKSVANAEKFTGRVNRYFRGVLTELKKVHWPTRQELITYTSVVLASVFLVAIVIWLVDSVFSFLLELIL